jgi:hypothetical protein
MGSIEFVENYDDLSTDLGFQFRFRCDRCGNGFESTFVSSTVGVAGSFLRAAGGLLGGVVGQAGSSSYEIQRAIGGPAHDRALRDAVAELKPKFDQCRRCGKWTCKSVCRNAAKGLCKDCAPDLADEAASAQAAAAVEQVREKARASDQTGGLDVASPTAAQCPKCGAGTTGGKFCTECGAALAAKTACPKCKASVAAGARFCPACGTKL